MDQAPQWVQEFFGVNESPVNPSQGYPQLNTFPYDEPVDNPWYVDVFDATLGMIPDTSFTGVALLLTFVATFVLLVWWLPKAHYNELASDAYDAEDHIARLNEDAEDRMYYS